MSEILKANSSKLDQVEHFMSPLLVSLDLPQGFVWLTDRQTVGKTCRILTLYSSSKHARSAYKIMANA